MSGVHNTLFLLIDMESINNLMYGKFICYMWYFRRKNYYLEISMYLLFGIPMRLSELLMQFSVGKYMRLFVEKCMGLLV